MDKSKGLAKQRINKPKVPAPPGDLFALGSKPKADAEPGPSSKLTLPPLRRDSQVPSSSLLSKKTTVPFIPVTKSTDAEKSVTSQAHFEEVAVDCLPTEFYDVVMSAYESGDDEKVERLLCGASRYLKNNRAKPDNQVVIGLLYFAKAYPRMFMADNVTAAFCSLLKRDPAISFKAKGNPVVTVLACNILYVAFAAEEQWPELFLKVFLEDSMGERIWVDRSDCRCFTENIITAYGTRFPPRSMMAQDTVTPATSGVVAAASLVSASTSPSGTPRAASGFPDDDVVELPSAPAQQAAAGSSPALADRLDSAEEQELLILPRYEYQQEAIEHQAIDFVNDQLTKRQAVDLSSRQLLKTVAMMCGLVDVCLVAVQRLEMWLQNPKLSRPAQDLLLFICYNCGQNSSGISEQKELEVTTQLLKLRLKTKQLLTHYLTCIRELMNQSYPNLHTVIALTVYNELSNFRNINNMAVLGTALQVSPEKASAILAEVFVDLLTSKEDYLRAVRGLLREIVRSARNDVDFSSFCLALMTEKKSEKFMELDASSKERLFASITDLVALSQLLCITPSVREAATASASKGDKRDIQAIRCFWKQVSTIQRDGVWFMQEVVPSSFELSKQDYIHGLYKILMMQPAESYYKVDGWPPDPDRHSILRLATETPVREETLIRILIIGLTSTLPLNAAEALDVADLMVRRAAIAAANIAGHVGISGASLLEVINLDLIQLLFNAASYHYPENIKLPKGYAPPCLAIATSYWKVWQMLLIISAFNPSTFGRVAWESYETLRVMMEMVMTNSYRFPPPTFSSDEGIIQRYLQKERQAAELEKQVILEFEGHLAAASSKSTITEQSSVLLSLLMSMEPAVDCRKPPDDVLENLRAMNKTMGLGQLLCRSRDPDFLLSIIERQGAAGSMPWLADLVDASESSLDVLPVQCLCEFLLHEVPQAPTTTPSILSPEEAAVAAALSGRRKSSSSSSVVSAMSVLRDADNAESMEKSSRSTAAAQLSKHEKLLSRLRSLLFTPDTFGSVAVGVANEILNYFLQRLLLPSSASRASAIKGLSAVLSGASCRGKENAMEMDDDQRAVGACADAASSSMLAKFGWLLEDLPCIPAYHHVKANVMAHLGKALRSETSPEAIEAYLIYLSKESVGSSDALLERTVEALSCALVERSAVLRTVLMPSGSSDTQNCSELHHCLAALYVEFTRRACNPHWAPARGDKDEQNHVDGNMRIIVDWRAGHSAVMSLVVAQGIIILLTLCEPATMRAKHNELYESWFPSDCMRPAIRRVRNGKHERDAVTDNCDGDVQLCPDFLRLLMLQSRLPRLVDAAVEDVGIEKLIVFVQSFGIPKEGTTKLMHVLDEASLTQPEAVLAAAHARKEYLIQLIEIQQIRGIKAGSTFHLLLSKDTTPTSLPFTLPGTTMTAASAAQSVAAGFTSACANPLPAKSASISTLQKYEAKPGSRRAIVVPETAEGIAGFIRQVLLALCNRISLVDVRHHCKVLQMKMAASEAVRHAFVGICAELLAIYPLADTFWKCAYNVAPLLRLVIGLTHSEGKMPAQHEAGAVAAASALFQALARSRPLNVGNSALDILVTKASSWLCPTMDTDIGPDNIDINSEGFEHAMSNIVTELILSGKPDDAARLCTHKISEAEMSRKSGAVGLLLDWVRVIDLEIVGADRYDSGTPGHEVIALLFGRRQSCSMSCAAYLRAVLLHQTNWDTIRSVIHMVLGEHHVTGAADRFDSTAVLDFLNGCIRHPKLYQGRVRNKPKKDLPDNVLGLSAAEIGSVARLIVSEVEDKPRSAAIESIDSRMELLCACCHGDAGKLKMLAQDIEKRATSLSLPDPASDHGDTDSDTAWLRRLYKYLLIRLYAWAPDVAKWLHDDTAITDADPAVFLQGSCTLDARTHKVLAALGAAVGAKKKNEMALNDANLLCRKLAADHPLLFLRQLPMMLALLCGRCEFTFNEFKQRNHLLLFTHVFGIAELLQPHIFIHQSFGSFVELYLDFFRIYAHKALAPFFGKFVQLLHNFIHCTPSQMAHVLAGHSATLSYLCNVYPAMTQAKSLLSALSLPQKEAAGVTCEEKHLTLPPANPPLTVEQLAPFRARLNRDASVDDVIAVLSDIDSTSMIKVDILSNFVDDLKRLLSAERDECRNTAHSLMMRYLRHNPRGARDFVNTYAACLEHESADVKKSALLNLAEFTVLCDEDDVSALLQRAFVAAMRLDASESMTHVKEALQLLHLENVQML